MACVLTDRCLLWWCPTPVMVWQVGYVSAKVLVVMTDFLISVQRFGWAAKRSGAKVGW